MGAGQSSTATPSIPLPEGKNTTAAPPPSVDLTAAMQKPDAQDVTVALPLPPPTATTPKEEVIGNPGDFEEIGKKAKELFPMPFTGARLNVTKGLSRYFQTTHTLTLPPDSSKGQYQFGGMYVGSKMISENEYRPLLVGDISTNGNFMMMLAHHLTQKLRTKTQIQYQDSKWAVYQFQADYCGPDFTLTGVLANPNLFEASGVAVAQYLQSVTPRLSLGAECMLQRSQGVEVGVLSLAGRYTSDKWEAAAKASMMAWDLSYVRKVTDFLTFAANLETSMFQEDSKMTAGYTYDLPESDLSFKGSLSTDWTVATTMEKRLEPLPASLVLSVLLDHAKNECKVGVGFSLG